MKIINSSVRTSIDLDRYGAMKAPARAQFKQIGRKQERARLKGQVLHQQVLDARTALLETFDRNLAQREMAYRDLMARIMFKKQRARHKAARTAPVQSDLSDHEYRKPVYGMCNGAEVLLASCAYEYA
jgi:hypothetical protein